RGSVRQGGLPAAPRRAGGEQAGHDRPDVRVLHDGEADDPETARRLQGETGVAVFAAGIPRRLRPVGSAAAATDPQGAAGGARDAVLKKGDSPLFTRNVKRGQSTFSA